MKISLALMLLVGCTPPSSPAISSWAAGPSLSENLINCATQGLPTLSPKKIKEYQAWAETSNVGGDIARRTDRNLSELSALARTSFLLHLIESRHVGLSLKHWAYAWWAKSPHDAGLPRMILRLRYEKDPKSVIFLCQGLLRLKNGSGLDAIHLLLADESLANHTRQLAKESLALLPNHPGHGANFEEEWGALKDCRKTWASSQFIGERTLSTDFEAEFWKMAHRFESQPLRPVDEARFVFRRLGPPGFGLLMQAAKDPNHYVREHALQTMAWIGEPMGRWCLPQSKVWQDFFYYSLQNQRTRTRALAALGAMGIPEGSPLIFPYLENGNREVQTAAADALLRCCPPKDFQKLRTFFTAKPGISPEARFSLALLLQLPVEVPQGLDQAEIERRQRWYSQRWSP